MRFYIGRDYKGKFMLAVAGAPRWFLFGEPARIGSQFVRRLI